MFICGVAVSAVLASLSPCRAFQIGAGEKPLVVRPEKKSKRKELPNQTLEKLPQPPLAVALDGVKLSYLAAPLSSRGLLSQQTRDALKWLLSQTHGAQIVHVRGFVSGSGDMRRVPQLVSEMFADRHLPLPVVVTVQVGALPLEGAQVQLEATLQQSRAVNPAGVKFVTAEAEGARAALDKLKQSGELLRATCYVPALGAPESAENVTWIQPQRLSARAATTCEGVVKNAGAGEAAQPLVITGAQLAFSYSEEDAKLAFERLEKTLRSVNSTLRDAVYLNVYPLSAQLAAQAGRSASAYLNAERAPDGVRDVVFEGLPSMDGSFAVEAVATISSPK
jgi:enamine deaminase RidA (YjgF/YER057c/UK114 family)